MQKAELASSEGLIAVVTGTHSSGKSTLISDLELGKLAQLGIKHPEYNDFGFSVIKNEKRGRYTPVVTVPESARWLADMYERPDFLAKDYSLNFQLNIDSEGIFRFHAALELAASLSQRLVEEGFLERNSEMTRPVVIGDRGPLDGIIYSELRCPEADTNIIGTSPRTGFMSEWLKTYVSKVFIADHTEVPFEQDAARLDDIAFRDLVAKSISLNYVAFLGEKSVVTLRGDRKSREAQLIQELTEKLDVDNTPPRGLPYDLWAAVKIIDPNQAPYAV